MKRLPFKLQITLWYSGFMILFLAITLTIIYTMSATSMLSKTDESLINTLDKAQDYVTYRDGVFRYDEYMHRLDESIAVVVYDQFGNVLYGEVPRLFPVDTPFSNVLATVRLPNQNRYVYRDLDIEVAGAKQKLVLRGVASYTRASATLNSFLFGSLIVAPIIILLAIFGGWRLMKQIFKPIDYVRSTAQAISDGDDLKLRIETPENNDEIAKLVLTLNHMLKRLDDAFEREREFSDDVSHELRTPLSGMLLDIELLQSKTTQAEQVHVLSRLHYHTTWMIELIESMSALSNQVQIKKLESVNLNQVVSNYATMDGRRIQVDIDTNIMIKTDTLLFNRILSNLINNAFQYRASQVMIATELAKDDVRLKIKDNGIGIDADQLDNIWDRFYQVDASRHDSKTFGLGLSFVKLAIMALGWEISVESEPQKYTEFTIFIKKD